MPRPLHRIRALPAEVREALAKMYPQYGDYWESRLAAADETTYRAALKQARAVAGEAARAADELALRLQMATGPKGGLEQHRALQRGLPSAKSRSAEARRGRKGMPPRAHVILPTAEGWAVYNAVTGARESGFWPSARGEILEDYAAIEVGITPTSLHARARGGASPALAGSGLFLGPGGAVFCPRHLPAPEDRRRGENWRELSVEEVKRREAKSREKLLCEDWQRH